MAAGASRRRLGWQPATVADVRWENPQCKSIFLSVAGWPGHRPGQHLDLRLTAEDGYQAQRSYSIASAPGDELLMITVDCLPDGEVSPYLVDQVRPGDQLELRGPIGGYFVWDESRSDPVTLIAGGSGIAPFRSFLRHHEVVGSTTPIRLLYSTQSSASMIFRDELQAQASRELIDIDITLTREQPADWTGYRRRIDAELLGMIVWPAEEHPVDYVCGPTGFVEKASDILVALGHEPGRVLTERFGGTREG
ncbi:oxidoreductase [Microlunatus sp. Gsoil 973]|nr:oxidoreductase [Microlunatus sp. Gsoil 973]